MESKSKRRRPLSLGNADLDQAKGGVVGPREAKAALSNSVYKIAFEPGIRCRESMGRDCGVKKR
jgi:hypothetical protein